MENEDLVDFLVDRYHMLRWAKKLRNELMASLEEARDKVAELESKILEAKLEIYSLKDAPKICKIPPCIFMIFSFELQL
jgi:hypothetical protein